MTGKELREKVVSNVGKVIIGKEEVVTGIFCREYWRNI